MMRRSLCLLAAALWSASASAQTPATASLRGRVVDESGSSMPGVMVKLANPAAPLPAATTITDLDGGFLFLSLPPGREYTLTASIPDYATVIAGPLELKAGRETRLNLSLKPSSDLQETVRVEARGGVVETSSTTAATSYNAEFIEGIPLVGRSFGDLLTLAPGVTDPDGDGRVNVRGARDTGLQLRIDGTNVTDPLTGHIGQGINLEAVEEIEILTAAAGADYGRADGGFANVITKSGGNETAGSFKTFYRTQFLDGLSARAKETGFRGFNDLNVYGTLGGALVKDHLWYFVAVERLDEELPVIFEDGETRLKSVEGWHNFAKVTWQASAEQKLSFQLNHDPLEALGNNQEQLIDPNTDYLLSTAGTLPQVTWTAVLSPSLLMQTVVSQLDARAEIEPLSEFDRIHTVQTLDTFRSLHEHFPCRTWNCDGDGIRRFLVGPQREEPGGEPQREDGNYNILNGVDLSRFTVRSDLSYTIEDWAGQHGIKSGFLYEIESYREELQINPVLIDRTCTFPTLPCETPAEPNLKGGFIDLQIYDPGRRRLTADGFNVGWYAQDSWKVLPNLTLNLGTRVDWEEIDTTGFTSFEPGPEAREALRRYEIVCEAAGSSCSGRTPGRRDGILGTPITPPPGSPALEFDVNGDGIIDLNGAERDIVLLEPFTVQSDRLSEAYGIENVNLSPRFGLSWDPWADGRTKLFSTWGRYHDRLFLGAVVTDQKPTSYLATWSLETTPEGQVQLGEPSMPVHSAFTVLQTDRDLSTPYTDEWTIGFERELAPEWTLGMSYIHRRGNDLLQDQDINHITCEGFGETLGVDPQLVCGDAGSLELDRFGTLNRRPNGAPDLYHLNPFFNQILRIGNYNSSRYRAWEMIVRKRLHNNWQMQIGYTWSKAEGDAESFTSVQGNDPAVSDKVSGFLDYDQRHVFKLQTVTHLRGDILLGAAVQWGSGLPYTFVSNVQDYDDQGLLTPQRIFSVTGKKNDQRNESQLTVDGRVEKRLNLKGAQVSAFLAGENLLDRDELTLRQVDRDRRGIVEGQRRPGRRFEIGASILF
ncbi:MAG TPA: TonB-dependent receptor [Candidatus Polarisedimenticolia bacterium]|nr:TonB-dependent receptor [Candidatus Polarisedimenticolia bacterium]